MREAIPTICMIRLQYSGGLDNRRAPLIHRAILDSFGICGLSMTLFGVRGASEMIVSLRDPIQIKFHDFHKLNSSNYLSELHISGQIDAQPSGRQKIWCQETLCYLSQGTGWYLSSASCAVMCWGTAAAVPQHNTAHGSDDIMSLGITPSAFFCFYPQPLSVFTPRGPTTNFEHFWKRWDPYTLSQTRFSNALDYNRSKLSVTLTQIGLVHINSLKSRLLYMSKIYEGG